VKPAAIDQLVREGHNLAYGARFLKRVIDDRVKIPLSEIWGTGACFRVDAVDGAIAVTAVTAGAAGETRLATV
jgi:ATP-dependent Clp protease ATP-binding subunit ClpA